ncbi:MAG: DUF3408 domain-containing protein [Prevotella sp.]|nr:DUF3408 domain-containing protein [Prevotella sp.]
MATERNNMKELSDEQTKEVMNAMRVGCGLSEEKLAERYPIAFAMSYDDADESAGDESPQEDAMTSVNDTIETTAPSIDAGQQPPTPLCEEQRPASVASDKDDAKQPPSRRVSSKQRRLSLEEYSSVFLPVPKIESRMPVFISASLRDELDKIARRLGGKRMSASGIVENMVRHHLISYGDELKEWYKL